MKVTAALEGISLEPQGYQLEHNFGHGFKFLCNNFVMLMMLAFMVDQILQACCPQFQNALIRRKRKVRLWEGIKSVFDFYIVDTWEMVYSLLAEDGIYRRVSLASTVNTT